MHGCISVRGIIVIVSVVTLLHLYKEPSLLFHTPDDISVGCMKARATHLFESLNTPYTLHLFNFIPGLPPFQEEVKPMLYSNDTAQYRTVKHP